MKQHLSAVVLALAALINPAAPESVPVETTNRTIGNGATINSQIVGGRYEVRLTQSTQGRAPGIAVSLTANTLNKTLNPDLNDVKRIRMELAMAEALESLGIGPVSKDAKPYPTWYINSAPKAEVDIVSLIPDAKAAGLSREEIQAFVTKNDSVGLRAAVALAKAFAEPQPTEPETDKPPGDDIPF
jgi:hypothetical protein